VRGGEAAIAIAAGGPTGRGEYLRRACLFAVVVVCVVIGGSAFSIRAAQAFEIKSFNVTTSTTQAGGHPDVLFSFETEYHEGPQTGSPCQCNDSKNLDLSLPTGLIGDPHATPQCTSAEFSTESCPGDSQVGFIHPTVDIGGNTVIKFGADIPIYNLVAKPGQAGLIAWEVPLFSTPVYTVLSARTDSDYGLNADTDGIEHGLPLVAAELELWGVPASPIHDGERWTGGPSNSPQVPFLQNPTACRGALVTTLNALAYDHSSAVAEETYPATTGCDQLSFNPSNFVQPTTTETDSASGVALELSVPQNESPTVPSPSEIRATTVTLPPGFVLSPNASDGKTSCSDIEAGFGTLNEAHCPEYSKIGTVEIDSPTLPAPLLGSVFIGEAKPGDRYRFVLTADGFNVHVKLLGSSFPSPESGQQVIVFENLPQFPFSAFKLHFFGSERGILETPTQCGTYPVQSTFTPWDAALPEQTSTQFFVLDSGPNGTPCPGASRPFTPTFRAASAGNLAGQHTSFSVDMTRNDGDQNLAGLSVTTPPGLSATLKGVPYCPDVSIAAAAAPTYSGLAEQSHPSCPLASQIGTAVAGVGAGTHPVFFQGEVYLAGPYKGAPLSLVVITPGISGPYDLGNVVVRAALHVNPETAQITAVSDPLPSILQGIPLRYREILIELNRSNFILNPTNCNAFSVNAQISGDQGAQAGLSHFFQVANCANLPFSPKLNLRLSGATERGGNPALNATLTANPGNANIASTAVTLPPTEQIDNAHIKNPCTRVEFAQGSTPGEKCPPGSVIGFARAETPLLEKPLEGPVYLRSAPENKSGLPDLVAALNGQIDIALDGKITTMHGGRLRTTFATVPDAPVSKFTLSIDGGAKGLLVNNENICKGSKLVASTIAGQNGLVAKQGPGLQTPCARGAKTQRHLQRARVVR
jgi:hypothetical protein